MEKSENVYIIEDNNSFCSSIQPDGCYNELELHQTSSLDDSSSSTSVVVDSINL